MRKNQLAALYCQSSLVETPLVGWSSTEMCKLGIPSGVWGAGPVHSATNRIMEGDARLIRIAIDVAPPDAFFHLCVLIFSHEEQLMTKLGLKDCSGRIGCRDIDVFMKGIPLDVKIRLLFQMASTDADKAFVSGTYVSVLA